MSALRGKINYVSLKDFVTYDSVTFYPGEYLNVIIGPNGTGKSTLVAAIVLGMGGSPKVLSRSLNIGDYVKNGKQAATISIGIYQSDDDPEDVLHFQRVIDISGKNRYSLNQKGCTMSDFLKSVAALNIQVDNLCQFLPQDRVQDFAKQNAQELLASTQCSVCAPEVEQTFEKLKELRQQQKSQESDREGNIQKLADYVKRNEGLEAQIKALEARNTLVTTLGVCNKKKAWMEFEDLYIKLQELQTDLQKAEENLKRHQDEMRPLQDQIKTIDSTKKMYDQKITKARNECAAKTRELQALDDQQHTKTAKMAKNRGDFEFAKNTNAERSQEVESANSVQMVLIHDLKKAAELAGSEDERKAAMAKVNGQITNRKIDIDVLLEKRRHISSQLDEQVKPFLNSLQTKIKSAQSINDRKLEVLRTRFEDAYRGTLWLRKNLHLFKGKVYEPMLLELNVMDSKNAKYFENCIDRKDLVAFACEEKEDMKLLHQKLRNEEKLSVNMIHAPPATALGYAPHRPISDLHNFGCHSYLIDLIEGPAPLLNFLCKSSRLHLVPVGNEKTYEMSEQLPSNITLFFTTNHRFSIVKSKYSKQSSSTSNEIQGHNLMNIGIDKVALDRLKKQHDDELRKSDRLKNDRQKIEAQVQQLEEQTNELLAERQTIQQKTRNLEMCNENLRRQMNKIKNIAPPINLVTERVRIDELNKALLQEVFVIVTKKKACFQDYSEFRITANLEKERFEKFMQANAELHNLVQQRQADVDKAKKLVDKIKDILERNKKNCKEKHIEAKQLTDGLTPNDKKQFPYKAAFEQLPDVMEELLEHMNDLEGQINCIVGGSDSVVAEYETRKQQIAQLRTTIANFDTENATLDQRIDDLHGQWHSEMLRTVSVINENFSHFMSAMRFAGEVELVHNDPHDYVEYGIEIRVKYRNNEKMQTLDRNVQSGGERAVAIAIYSLSLQQISHVPFRCVDEINQGMDSTNERKIFDMLVEQTAKPGKSQYFFVTPKLLPQLNYNDLMTVHIVFNGQFVEDATMFEQWR